MLFYHRTTVESWVKIKLEGILWGVHDHYRYTYLSPTPDVHIDFGPILLQVKYIPQGLPFDNYYIGGWQFSVFVAIPMANIMIMKVFKDLRWK